MRRWIISDTHFGHSELQAHERRPADVDARIAGAWNRIIKPEDLVIHIGDVAFNFVRLKDFLDSLPGKKILVRGNHDSKSVTYYMSNGFDFACDGITISRVYFSHKPSPTLPKDAEYNIHGHFHKRFPENHREFPHCRLFSLEYTNYEPRLLEKFLQHSNNIGSTK
jgi:calcineurin-like phosphoesterase family protein